MNLQILSFLGISHWEIIIVVLALALLFGARKLPGLARNLGAGLRGFKHELFSSNKDVNPTANPDSASKQSPPSQDPACRQCQSCDGDTPES